MATGISKEYKVLLAGVLDRVRSAQYEALRLVNRELSALYWDIGRMITERQEGETWGLSVVAQLAHDLQTEFPGLRGFSERNIWQMRKLYLAYRNNQKLQPLAAEIAWTHNLIIMDSCPDDLEREFYIRMTRKMGWSKNVLIHQIENKTYEKTLLNQTNFDHTLSPEVRNHAKLAVKDDYLFDFLELGEEHSEQELERAILSKIEPFLKEMGGAMAFIGRQYRLEVGGREFFLDLLLYHRTLKCLVAVELKVGEFEPEHVGKMQFYLVALDKQVKQPDENPSIGLVLCKTKDKTVVEYALLDTRKPIGIAEYRLVSKLPMRLRGQLPDPRQIATLLEVL